MLCRRDLATESLRTSLGFSGSAFQAELAGLAQRHGVFGLVLLALERSELLAELPAAVAQDYTSTLRLLRRQAALWDLERDFVLGLLAERGIPAVLLKGAALRLTAYPDSVQRSFGDLDILVPEASVDDAVRTLSGAGYQSQAEARARLYREHHHHLILRKEMGFVVEVHWGLEPVRSPFALDPLVFRRDALPHPTRDGRSALVPSAEHNVLHLSTQSLEDGFSRLGRIIDLDRVVSTASRQFDWDRLAMEAIRMQVNNVVALSLRLSQLLLGTEIPDRWFERLALSPASRASLGLLDPIGVLLEQRSRRRASLEKLFLLWCIPDRETRWSMLRAMYLGQQDWFAHLMPAEGDAHKRHSPAVGTLKLALYQLWIYLSAPIAPRRTRRFWTLRLDQPA